VYNCPAVRVKAVCRNAALGANVPGPPLSFQPSGCPAAVGKPGPLTMIPRSWLKLAVEVHRSEFAVPIVTQLNPGVKVTERGVAPVPMIAELSIEVQVVPSLLLSWYWPVLTAV